MNQIETARLQAALTSALDHMMDAHSQNSNKHIKVREWFQIEFNTSGRASRVSETKQAYNRVPEQFKHQDLNVIFVVDDDGTGSVIEAQVKLKKYPELNTCLVLKKSASIYTALVLMIASESDVNLHFREAYPEVRVVMLGHTGSATAGAPFKQSDFTGINLIFFGPPGTGKSTEVKRMVASAPMFRTQFHPEYSHVDFIGGYRPVVGSETDTENQIIGHDGVRIPRPVNYFAFVPGPLALVLECAFRDSEHVFLVIEEINRGDCAAIFGDVFQLLDRDDEGRSEFGITPRPELVTYFKAKNITYDTAADGKLYLPPNLSLLATMNTSDQSLYPMDSAFKRRWQWVACPIDFEQLLTYTGGIRPFLDDGKEKWDWIKIVELINKDIVRDRMEDKQLGPWFIKPAKDGLVPWDSFLSKCLFYLWHDVFKDEQLSDLSPFITDGPEVFGEVQANIRDNGLAAGIKSKLLFSVALTQETVSTEIEQTAQSTQEQN